LEDVETPLSCAAPPGGGRRFLGRCGFVAVRLCGGGMALLVAVAIGLAVVLARGPLRLEAVSRGAEVALAELGGAGASARVGATGLDWSWSGGVSVALSDVAVEREPGLRIEVPQVLVRLRLLPLFIGEVRPRTVEVFEPKLTVATADLQARTDATPPLPPERPADAAAAPPAGAATPVSTRLAEAADLAVERALHLARDLGFETVTLRGGDVELRHPGPDGVEKRVHLREVEVDGVVDGPGGEVDAGISARGEVGRWTMRLTRSPRDDGGHRLAFSADDVTLADLLGAPGPAFAFGLPFYPRLDLGFDARGHFDGADLDLRLGAGLFRFGTLPEDRLLFDEITARAMWSPRDRVFVIRQAQAAIGDTRWAAHGRIVPPAAPEGQWAWDFEIDPGQLAPRDVAGRPVAVHGGRATGTWDPTLRFFDVTLGEVRFGEATLRSAGRLDLAGEEPKFTYDLQFSPLTVEEVAHAWPTWVAKDARAWFTEKVAAGRIADLRIQLAMPRFDRPETWPGDALRMSGRFEGGRFSPLGNLPAVTAAEGRLSVADRRFEVVVDKAHAATKGREPAVEGFRFAVADIFAKPARGSVRLKLAGDVGALAEIVDAEPIAALKQAGLAAGGLTGTGTVTAAVDVVFEDKIDAKSIDYKVEALLDGFASQQPIQGRKFESGKFKIVADAHGLDVSGRAVVDGVPTDVHVFDPAGEGKKSEKRDFKMELDDAARQRVGLDLGGLVEGAIGLSVSQPDPTQLRSRVEADLGPARLTLAPLGWTKGPGVPAKATFDLWDDDKGLHVDNLALDSEGLALRGNLLLDKDRNLVAADFTRFALRKGDAAKVKVTRGGDKAYTIVFEGTDFDVRGLLAFSRRPPQVGEGTKAPPDLVLKIRSARLKGYNDVALADVSIDGRWRAGAFQSLELRARTGDKSPLSLAIRPEGDHRRFTAVAEDAGLALSFLDLFDRIEGGKLTLSARLTGPGVSEGTLRLVDFHLLEEPKAGRGVASDVGADGTRRIRIRSAEIDRSTNFDRAQVRFSMHEGIVDVTEGIAKGASTGATANGQIDVAAQRLSLSGTYIPAYGLNNLAGRIPIFGAIAGAGSNEGLVGVTFRVGGRIDDPILEINPLSAVAPGIFRRIFEFQRGEMQQSSGDPNAPTNILPESGPTRITP
jgi:hypothetical protein